jgi:hypothetical protein
MAGMVMVMVRVLERGMPWVAYRKVLARGARKAGIEASWWSQMPRPPDFTGW